MAVIWSKHAGTDTYEVRTAGNSVRLYKNRVFHTQWNPQRPLSNGVWDLLFLPALFLPPGRVQRVLLLGVGGGAVINQFRHLLAPAKIVGVELDPVHLSVAREHFSVKHKSVELHCADAITWLRDYRGEPFDLIIEDLFTEREGEPERAVTADVKWFSMLLSQLRPGGALVINFEDPPQMRQSGAAYLAANGIRPDVRYHFSQPTYGNSVCAFLGDMTKPAVLRERLSTVLLPYPDCRATGQKFRVRRVV